MKLSKIINLLLLALAGLCFGCTNQLKERYVFADTSTALGFQVSENPVTSLYEAKLGYARNEVFLVPSTNGGSPDVLAEFNFSGLGNGGIYQRIAVGSNAVSQAGAAVMFSKDATGAVIPTLATSVSNVVSGKLKLVH